MKFERDSASRRVNAPGSVCGANRAFTVHATLRLRVVTPEDSGRMALRLTDLELFSAERLPLPPVRITKRDTLTE